MDNDLKNVIGLEYAKRAFEVAVSGGHSILIAGAKGSGKTTLINAFPNSIAFEQELCPCGYYLSEHYCDCNPKEIRAFRNNKRIERGDFLYDINIMLKENIYFKNILAESENSETVFKRIEETKKLQKRRYEGSSIVLNGQLATSEIKNYCILSDDCKDLIKNYFAKFGRSIKDVLSIIKVSRTIADMDKSVDIRQVHVAEAIQYKMIEYI